jgi:hypothetical protein
MEMIIFKSESNSVLLSQIDERIDLINKVSEESRNIENVDLIQLWKTLYKEIKELWMENDKIPFIKLTELQGVKLNFLADIVAMFFLHNGSEVDNDFLKNVSELFKEVNKTNKITLEERWIILKKLMKK